MCVIQNCLVLYRVFCTPDSQMYRSSILRTARKDDFEAYWQDEKAWLCTIEFLPTDDPEARAYTADFVGCLLAYAHLTNSRSLALLGDPDPDADAHEILFSFASPEEKRQFLDLIRSNEDLGNDYIENDFMAPTNEEIRNARPLQTILPEDVLSRAVIIATSICVGAEDDRAASERY